MTHKTTIIFRTGAINMRPALDFFNAYRIIILGALLLGWDIPEPRALPLGWDIPEPRALPWAGIYRAFSPFRCQDEADGVCLVRSGSFYFYL
jgi:hypothetical protein